MFLTPISVWGIKLDGRFHKTSLQIKITEPKPTIGLAGT